MPYEFSTLIGLKELDLSCNRLTELPLGLRYLTSLTKLYLHNNPWGFSNNDHPILMLQYLIAGKGCIRAAYNALQLLTATNQHPKLQGLLQPLFKQATSGDICYASIPPQLATSISVDKALRQATSRYALSSVEQKDPTISALLLLRIHVEFSAGLFHNRKTLAFKPVMNGYPLFEPSLPKDKRREK